MYVARDRDGHVVWVGDADDVRREVRSLWTRNGGSVHASVLRDTTSWEVHTLDSPWCRRVAVERLLHEHRPRAQRRRITGDQAAHVCLEPSKHGWRATTRRAVDTPRRGAPRPRGDPRPRHGRGDGAPTARRVVSSWPMCAACSISSTRRTATATATATARTRRPRRPRRGWCSATNSTPSTPSCPHSPGATSPRSTIWSTRTAG
ncbi:MAG: hypothetical protein R2713_03980 [Ilumatobacteraceae bacterium]